MRTFDFRPEIAFMTVALGTSARQALIALMVRVTQVSNPDLRKSYRMEIDKATRHELTDAKLITWEKGARGAIFHQLTELGWIRARQEFLLPPPEKVSGAWLLHYATLRHLASLLDRNDYQIADVYSELDPGPPVTPGADNVEAEALSIGERVRKAYLELAETPGAFVSLLPIRDRLSDVDRADLDLALKEMDRRREIHLDPDPKRNALSQRAREAAIVIGGEDKHLVTLGDA